MKFVTSMVGFALIFASATVSAQSPKGAKGIRSERSPNSESRPQAEQNDRAANNIPQPQPAADSVTGNQAGIQWFATLERGLAEAERTGKPILFVSGNPSCAGVSGMWCPGKGHIDTNYLHKPEVIAAAKNFVCIRLAAYEDETEQQFMSSKLMNGGPVMNTTFGILAPDCTRAVASRGGGMGAKGPSGSYKDSAEMAKGMAEVAAKYPPKVTEGVPALPIALSAKVGLAIAAADNQPLVVVLASDATAQKELEAKVAALAWNEAFSGRYIYATALSMKEIPKVHGSTISEGVLIIEPDMFGAGGKVIKEVAKGQLENGLATAMREEIQSFVPLKKESRRALAAQGLQEGIFYETGVPVSGAGEAKDRERYKQQLLQKKKE